MNNEMRCLRSGVANTRALMQHVGDNCRRLSVRFVSGRGVACPHAVVHNAATIYTQDAFSCLETYFRSNCLFESNSRKTDSSRTGVHEMRFGMMWLSN